MRILIFYFVLFFFAEYSFCQNLISTSELQTINTNKTASEGDQYLNTETGKIYIGITSGTLREFNDNLGNHQLEQNLNTNGQFLSGDSNLNSGIFIDSIGNIGIGHSNPTSLLDLRSPASGSSGFILPSLTQLEIDNIDTTQNVDGMMVYNLDTRSVNILDKSSNGWKDLISSKKVSNELFFEDTDFAYVSLLINTSLYKVVRYSKTDLNQTEEAVGSGIQPSTLADVQGLTYN